MDVNKMFKVRTLGLAAIAASALAVGCASQPTTVRQYAAESMFCDESELLITELEHDSSNNDTHYEVRGCGKKQNYVCKSTANRIAMAAGGLIDLDQRRCRRELR
jgi:hypothetical protein